MEKLERPRRADARRNRARIIGSARKLFARLGNDAQMEEIAADSGLGMGTLYRHFPNKQALLTEIVRERFEGMIELAQAAERIEDPGEAFEAVLGSYLEAADGDAAFQLALLGSTEFEWEGVVQQKAEFAEIVTRIIDRAVAAGDVRDDLSVRRLPADHQWRDGDDVLQAERQQRLAPTPRARARPGPHAGGGRRRSAVASVAAMVSERTARALMARLAAEQSEQRLPSVVAGLVRDGELIWTGGRGKVDGRTPDADVQYRCGSITKTFVGVSVMRLRDEGRLSLSDTVDRFLSGTGIGELTIAELMSHSAGCAPRPARRGGSGRRAATSSS